VRVSEGAVKKSRMRENFKSGSVREGASPMGTLSLYSTNSQKKYIPGIEEKKIKYYQHNMSM
jgi:hypothetical protein